jgi:hypothetical protein
MPSMGTRTDNSLPRLEVHTYNPISFLWGAPHRNLEESCQSELHFMRRRSRCARA